MAKHKTLEPVVSVPPVRQFTDLALDEATFPLCFDFESYIVAEGLSKCNIFHEFPRCFNADGTVRETPSARLLGAMFWGSIRVAHPDMEYSQAMRLVTPKSHSKIFTALCEVWALWLRDPTVPADAISAAPVENAAA